MNRFVLITILFVQALTISYGDINKLTGQAQFTIDLGTHAKLLYKGGVAGAVSRPNEQSPAGVAGLGWYFGTSYIYVDHKYTVDRRDDAWYWCDGYGAATEIVRSFNNDKECFYLQNSPEQTIKVHYSNAISGEIPKISGWEIYGVDGTVYRYGYVTGESDDAARGVPSWGNYIGKGVYGSCAGNKPFYYRWDLKAIDDVNGQRTQLFYDKHTASTSTGCEYTDYSHIKEIHTPVKERIIFDYDLIPAGNEGRCEPNLADFDLDEKKYLRKVTLKNNDGVTVADANLIYSGDAGQVLHVKHDKKGFAKRLLTAITSETKKEFNYRFNYSPTDIGFLTSIRDYKGGATEYTYETVQNTLLTEIPLGEDGWKINSSSDKHILLSKDIKVQLFDKTKMRWQKTTLPGITDVQFDPSKRKITLVGDYLVVEDLSIISNVYYKDFTIYKWIDDNWKLVVNKKITHTNVIKLSEEIMIGDNYILSQYSNGVRRYLDVFTLDSKGETMNLQQFNYLEWYHEKVLVKAAKSYFVSSYEDEGKIFGTVHRFNGTEWVADKPVALLPNGVAGLYFRYAIGNIIAFDDYYIAYVASDPYASGSEPTTSNYVICRWNPVTSQWTKEYFPDGEIKTYPNGVTCGLWPRLVTTINGSNDYLTLLEEGCRMMIYRYLRKSSGDYEWQRTYIMPEENFESPSYSYGNLTYACYFNKGWFGEIKGMDYTANMFAVYHYENYAHPNTTCLRWIGDNSSGQWKRALVNYESCLTYQEFEDMSWYDDRPNLFLNQETFGYYAGSTPDYFYYDYGESRFKPTAPFSYNLTGNHSIRNDIAVHFSARDPANTNKRTLIIAQRKNENWETGAFQRVKTITKKAGIGNNVTTTIDYEDNYSKRLAEPNNGLLFHSAVSEISSGIENCKTTTEYCIDSSMGLFGQVYATTMHKTNVTPYNDDTVRVSGWMMESDGYTPAMGWVRLRLYPSGQLSPLCQIDQKTGWFSVKLHNHDNEWFSFDRLYTDNPSAAYQMVFWVETPSVPGENAKIKYGYYENFRPIPEIKDHSAILTNELKGDCKNFTNIKINHTMVDKAFSNTSGSLDWDLVRRPDPFYYSINFYGVNEKIKSYRKIFQLRPVRTVAMKDGVCSITETPFHWYDSLNNLPMLAYIEKGDTALMQHTVYAHSKFDMMGPDIKNGQKHMLSQVATSTSYAVKTTELLVERRDPFTLNPISAWQTEFFSSKLDKIHVNDRIVISFSVSTSDPLEESNLVVYLLVNNEPVDMFAMIGIDSRTCVYKAMVSYVLPAGLTVNSIKLLLDNIEDKMNFCDLTATVHCNPWPDNNGAINAAAVTWNNNLKLSGTQAWQPSATYKWNVPLNNSTPVPGLAPFNYNNLQSNKLNSWKIADSNTLYTSYGAIQEKVIQQNGSKKLYTVSVKRNDIRIPSASITNANFLESGAFTCDYDLDETDSRGGRYFDLENGWAKGFGTSDEITPDAKHFGEKGLKATNSFGAVRTFRLERNRNYILSAWVKPIITSGTTPSSVPLQKGVVMNVTYRRSPENGGSWPLQVYLNEGSTPEIQSSGTVEVTRYGDWCYCELKVPASTDLQSAWSNGYEFATAWVGCPIGNGAGQSGTVYIDDIRFYPENAFVTTTYYDQKWYQPILSVDANNNPGQKVLYDEFGRTKEMRKVTSANPDYGTTITTTEYHLAGEPDVSWTKASGTIAAQANTGYMTTGVEPVDFTLPATCAVGDRIKIRGNGSGGWRIAQGDGQSISGEGLTRKSYGEWREIHPPVNYFMGLTSTPDGSKIWATVFDSTILYSNDHGKTWVEQGSKQYYIPIRVSADGNNVFAGSHPGYLYISHDGGESWGSYDQSRYWMSIACSVDGKRIVAADFGGWTTGGLLYISSDGGSNWKSTGPVVFWWSVACSNDGMTMVAGGVDNQLYMSVDGGITWIPKHQRASYFSVKCSADGKQISAMDNLSNLHSSYDGGNTWHIQKVTKSNGQNGQWMFHEMSKDGKTLVLLDYDTIGGMIYSSFDAGKTWCSYPETYNSGNWGVTMSDDGSNVAAFQYNGNITTGTLAKTTVTTTTAGPNGSLSGKQGSSIELEYLGSGQFRVNSFTGELDAR